MCEVELRTRTFLIQTPKNEESHGKVCDLLRDLLFATGSLNNRIRDYTFRLYYWRTSGIDLSFDFKLLIVGPATVVIEKSPKANLEGHARNDEPSYFDHRAILHGVVITFLPKRVRFPLYTSLDLEPVVIVIRASDIAYQITRIGH